MKHLQRYITPIELDYRKFERLQQSHKISNVFTSTIEENFETLETSDIDITSSHSMIEPIFSHNFSNTFQHQNGPNQPQYIQKTLVSGTNTKTLVNSITRYPIKEPVPQ